MAPSMAPSPSSPTSTTWNHEYNTLRREDLFRNPPTDHSAYPLLQTAINPHIESFDALFKPNGLISLHGRHPEAHQAVRPATMATYRRPPSTGPAGASQRILTAAATASLHTSTFTLTATGASFMSPFLAQFHLGSRWHVLRTWPG